MKKPSQPRHLRLVTSEENDIHGQDKGSHSDPNPGPYLFDEQVRIERIKASINRINTLMAELKEAGSDKK